MCCSSFLPQNRQRKQSTFLPIQDWKTCFKTLKFFSYNSCVGYSFHWRSSRYFHRYFPFPSYRSTNGQRTLWFSPRARRHDCPALTSLLFCSRARFQRPAQSMQPGRTQQWHHKKDLSSAVHGALGALHVGFKQIHVICSGVPFDLLFIEKTLRNLTTETVCDAVCWCVTWFTTSHPSCPQYYRGSVSLKNGVLRNMGVSKNRGTPKWMV